MRVIIAPTCESAERTRSLLTNWSASGLLDDFCWATATPETVERPDLPVFKVSDGTSTTMPFSEAIVGEGQPRLVAFYPFGLNEQFDPTFPDRVREFSEKARVVSAFNAAQFTAPALLLAAESIKQKIPFEALSPGLVPMFMLAVEDRSEPTDSNRLDGDFERFIPHLAHGLASTADLWTGSEVASAGLIEEIGMDTSTNVRLVRSFTRGLDMGRFVDEVAEKVLDLSAGFPNPDRRELDTLDDDRDLEQRLGLWVNAYWEKHAPALGCPVHVDQVLEPEEPYDILGGAFPEMGRRLKKFFQGLPQILTNLGRSIVENFALTIFVLFGGRKSGMRIRMGAGRVQLEDEEFTESLDKNFLQLWERIRAHGYPSEPDETASSTDSGASAAWEELYNGSISLIDGSKPDSFATRAVTLPNGSRRILVEDPSFVVPRPFPPTLGLAASEEIRSCDPLRRDPMFYIPAEDQGAAVADDIEGFEDDAEPKAEGGSTPLAAAQAVSYTPDDQTESVTAQDEETTDDEQDYVAEDPETNVTDTPKPSDQLSGTTPEIAISEEEEAIPEEATQLTARQEQELATSKRSILWKIGTDIARHTRLAAYSRYQLEESVRAEQEEPDEYTAEEHEAAMRRHRWSARFRSFILLVLTLGLGYFAWTQFAGSTRTVAIAVLALVALRLHVASVKRSLMVSQPPLDSADIAEAWTRELSEMILAMRRIALIVTAIAGLAIYLIAKYTDLSTAKLAASIGGVLLIWLIVLARAFLDLIMRRQGINRRYAKLVLDKWNLRRRLSLEAGALTRVNRRYREYLDWAEAIGLITHSPFVQSSEQQVTKFERVRIETTPFAMKFKGARTQDKREFYSEQMRNNLFAKGWVGLISDALQQKLSEQMLRLGAGMETGIYADTGTSANGPRRLFLNLLREGTGRSITEIPQSGELFRMIGEKNVDDWVDACPEIPAPVTPFANIQDLITNADRSAVWIHSWIGRRETVTGGVAVGSDLILTCRHPLGRPDRIEVRSYSGEIADGELFRVCTGADLALIRVEGLDAVAAQISSPVKADAAPDTGTSDGRSSQGKQPVFGLARSLASETVIGPVMGEVLSTGKTINVADLFASDSLPTPVNEIRFEAEVGIPGMPVFDSNGSIAGIQTDASHVKQWDSTGSFLRLVVPGVIASDFLADPGLPVDNGLLFNRQPVTGITDIATPVADFLGTLIDVPDENRYMRPEHFKNMDPTESKIASLWPKTIEWPVQIASVANGEIGFGKSLRVVIHRVELTSPLVWSDLKLIAEPKDDQPQEAPPDSQSLI